MRKPLFILTILSGLASTSCFKKEISKYPFEMEGVWYGDGNVCNSVLVVSKDGTGQFYSTKTSSCTGVFNPDVTKGEVKFRGSNLFIGERKYRFKEKPRTYEKQDSIYCPSDSLYLMGVNDFVLSPRKNYRITAQMELTAGPAFVRKSSYVFYKYINY